MTNVYRENRKEEVMGGEVMEIVDCVTGRVSTYPAYSDEFRSMQMQIDWQRRFHPDYRFFYRLRYKVDLNITRTTENAFVIQNVAATAWRLLSGQYDERR